MEKYFYELPSGYLSPEELLDKACIRELIEMDRYFRDYGHFKQERTCWFSDGQVFASWFKGPIDEFLEKSSRKDKSPSAHKIFNIPVWLHKNKAIAECICTINFRVNLNNEPVDLTVWSRLHYRCEKRNGKWGLIYFEGIYEKDRIDPVFTDSTFVIPRQDLLLFRPCNFYQCYRLAKYNADPFGGGLVNSDKWAGSDKPDTIDRLYKESSRWLFNQ